MLWPDTQTSRGSVGLNETRSIKTRFHSAVAMIRPQVQSKTTTRESASSVIAITTKFAFSVTCIGRLLSLNLLKFKSTIVLGLVLLFVFVFVVIEVRAPMAVDIAAAAKSPTGFYEAFKSTAPIVL